MGFAVPGVSFSEGKLTYGFAGWINDDGAVVTPKTTAILNKKYGNKPDQLHLRMLRDIRLPNQEWCRALESCTKAQRGGCMRDSDSGVNRLLRYVYAVDKFQDLTNWRLDHIHPLADVFERLVRVLDVKNGINKPFVLRRIDGRYFYRKYYLDRAAYAARIKRPDDSEGRPVKGYPGVLTKDGLYWYVSDAYMRIAKNAWKRVMVYDDESQEEEPVHTSTKKHESVLERLPPEMLINILAYSGDLTNVKLVSRYFASFVDHHYNDIISQLVWTNFVTRIPLQVKNVSDSTMALMRDDNDHISTSEKRRLSQISRRTGDNKENAAEDDDMQTKFNTVLCANTQFMSTRYTDPHHITVLSEDGLGDVPYAIFNDTKVDYILPSNKRELFMDKYGELKNEEGVELIDKSKFRAFFQDCPINMPFENWDSLPRRKLFDALLILGDIIARDATKIAIPNVEVGLVQLFSMSMKLGIVIPCEMAMKFLRTNAEGDHTEPKLCSGQLFVLIHKFHANINAAPYQPILDLFYKGQLNSDHHFWNFLRDNAPDLIGELLNRTDVQPESHILNTLVLTLG